MKVAIVHDWLVVYGGAERVLAELVALFPEADLFSLIDHLPVQHRGFLGGRAPRTSFLQSVPLIARYYPRLLPLMPAAIERFDLSGYDMVISNSHAVAKGVLTTSEQLHICYLQARNLKYIYEDRGAYPGSGIRKLAEDLLLPRLRVWDAIATRRPDVTVANSHYVSRWHRHRHGIPSEVIYPPVDTSFFSSYYRTTKEDYYVTVGRLEPYKRMDLVLRAFGKIPARLVVVGGGSMLPSLRRMASSNVEFAGACSKERVAELVSGARAFVFASREDFGIAPLEAQACGTPVIAFGKGGVRETVHGLEDSHPTGVFFEEQTPSSVLEAVNLFERESLRILADTCRTNALRFTAERFRGEFRNYVDTEVLRFKRLD